MSNTTYQKPADAPTPLSPECVRLAARRWLEEHGDVLWRFALARTRSPEAAEDVVQETLLAAMEGLDRFASASSERTWLLGIASHKVADYFRRRARSAGPDREGRHHGVGCGCPACAELFDRDGAWLVVPPRWPPAVGAGGDGGSHAEWAEQIEALRRCIDALPPRQREAFWLRDVLSLAGAEVCRALELTESNLWTILHRARKSLRGCLASKLDSGKEQRR